MSDTAIPHLRVGLIHFFAILHFKVRVCIIHGFWQKLLFLPSIFDLFCDSDDFLSFKVAKLIIHEDALTCVFVHYQVVSTWNRRKRRCVSVRMLSSRRRVVWSITCTTHPDSTWTASKCSFSTKLTGTVWQNLASELEICHTFTRFCPSKQNVGWVFRWANEGGDTTLRKTTTNYAILCHNDGSCKYSRS